MGRVTQKIIKAFRNGDKDAFEIIFYEYKEELYHYAYFFVKNYDDANDCVQEIFIRVVNKIHLYDEKKADFKIWLFTIARAAILNFIRSKETKYEKMILCDEMVENFMDPTNDNLKNILLDLENLMGKPMYIVYILRTGYDLSFELISNITKINRETARRMYNQSIQIVNEYMEEYNNEEKLTA